MNKLLLLLASVLMLQSCNDTITLQNAKIDAKLRETIYAKNEVLINAMISTDLNAYYSLESDEYRKQRQAMRQKPSDLFKKGLYGKGFKVYDEYLVTNSARYSENEVSSKEHGYTFKFRNDKLKSYVSILKVTGYQYDALLAVTYGLNDEKEWKIYAVDLFGYGNWGKNVKDYYRMAKQAEEKGFLINAYIYARNASDLIDPADDLKLEWEDQDAVIDYANALQLDIINKYTFPMVLSKLPSKPTVLSIQPRAI